MGPFLARRLATAIPTLLAVITASFFIMHAAPGSPFTGVRRLPPAVEHNLEVRYGLDRPLPEQFGRYLWALAHGDPGPSLKYPDKTVAGVIGEGLPTSAMIGAAALVLGVGLGVPLGVWAALRRGRVVDRIVGALGFMGVGLPQFVIGPLLALVFASWLGWLPTGGLDGPQSFVLPIVVLALPLLTAVMRLTRAGMVETLRAPFVRTARAQGLSPARVVLRYALPPALAPLVGFLGPATAGLLTGSLVVEELFGLPGVGRAFVISALQRDYTVVLGVVILYAALILVLNVLADLVAAALDPRARAT